MWVLHHCDNRACVRPGHLFLGTARDNTRDMLTKGRGGWRTQGYDPAIRDAVRRRFAEGGVTQKEVAFEFGVSHGSVSNWLRKAAA